MKIRRVKNRLRWKSMKNRLKNRLKIQSLSLKMRKALKRVVRAIKNLMKPPPSQNNRNLKINRMKWTSTKSKRSNPKITRAKSKNLNQSRNLNKNKLQPNTVLKSRPQLDPLKNTRQSIKRSIRYFRI